MNKKLLFEIGSEEIPARFVPNSIKQLKVITENKLKEYRIDFESINVFATPRRLTLYIDSINTTQSDLELTIKGPSIKAAFDNNKNPTRALEGFMRSNSVEIKDTFTKLSGKSEYIYAKKIEKGLPTKEILEKILPEILFSIKFSKTMKWGSYTIKYPRPIRWVVAIFGTDTLNIEIGNIKASNITFGHRTLSNKNVNLTPDTYFDKLKIANVIVNHNERKNMIRYQIENLSKSENADAQIDEELLEEVNYLVEYPTAFIGNFDQKYLNLPKEVVITPMKEHQRYFPLFKNGKLINKFIGVRNGDEKSIDIVKTGNERVLKARLEDAQFFYNEDKKIRLEERVNELKTIVYQEKLGTVYDKVLRVSKISDYIANELHLENEKKDMLKKTTLISKADLVTLMVNEFDELQGLMGMYYAIENNIDKEIAKALYTQYLPKFSGDNVPKDTLGMIMSISDRVDTIVGSFGIGTVPTGSNDPYGLRRQALGMISIILENNLNLDINKILRFSSHLYNNNVITNIDSVINEIDIFIRQRLRVLFIEKGYRYDIVDSLLDKQIENVNVIKDNISILEKIISSNENFKNIVQALIRVHSIAVKNLNNYKVKTKNISREEYFSYRKSQGRTVNESLLKENREKELYEKCKILDNKVNSLLKKSDYENVILAFEDIRVNIDNFFDNVRVMDENEMLKENRLALLEYLLDIALKIFNVDKIII